MWFICGCDMYIQIAITEQEQSRFQCKYTPTVPNQWLAAKMSLLTDHTHQSASVWQAATKRHPPVCSGSRQRISEEFSPSWRLMLPLAPPSWLLFLFMLMLSEEWNPALKSTHDHNNIMYIHVNFWGNVWCMHMSCNLPSVPPVLRPWNGIRNS